MTTAFLTYLVLEFHHLCGHDMLALAMIIKTLLRRAMATVALLSLTLSIAQADWPSYRRDSHRSAASWEAMRPELNLQWVFKPQHGPQAAWPLPGEETPRMHTDRAYHVAVANGLVYFGTSVDNKVHAWMSRQGPFDGRSIREARFGSRR